MTALRHQRNQTDKQIDFFHFPTLTVVAVAVTCLFWGATLVQAQDETNSPAELKKLSVEELMDIEVTSVARHPEKLADSPAAIDVITGTDIERSGASSIPEALRLADNLDVAQKNSHDWGISARGFNTALANKMLVLMDGRTLYTPLFSGVFWNVQDYLLADLDRIEVISGPGGTLWGANAVNGVISIVSKSAKDTQGLYVESGGGSELRDFGSVRYGGMLASNIYFRVYGKYFDRGNEVYPNGSAASDSWWAGQGGFRLDAEGLGENNFTLQGDIYGGNQSVPQAGEAKPSGGNVLGRWSHTISDDSDLSLQLYYDRTHLVDAVAPNDFLTDSLDTYDLDFQHRFKLGGRNQIVWGLGYRFTHDVVREAAGIAVFPPVLDHHLFSGFLQDEIMLWQDVFFTLGTKVEHNGYTGFEVEPNARLQWNVTTNQMLWAAVSRAVRTPSRIDRDLREPNGPVAILAGSSDFDSEDLIAAEVGYRAQLWREVSTSVSTFFNDYENVRSTTFTPGTFFPFVFQNNLHGYTYGLELSADYQALPGWRLHGGYDLLEEHLGVKAGDLDINNSLNETSDPKHQFSVRSSMDLPFKTTFDTGLRWVDTLHVNTGATVGTVPSYFELDARLGWRPCNHLEFSVAGQNLLHDHHPEYGFPSATRVEIGRSIYGKVVCKF